VRLRQQRVLFLGIEGALRFVDDGVCLGVRVPAPVDADWRHLARMEEADDGVERIGRHVGDVVGGDPSGHLVLGALAPIGVKRLKLDHLEIDLDADFLEALLQEFVDRQR
jgi:hypothetical protein